MKTIDDKFYNFFNDVQNEIIRLKFRYKLNKTEEFIISNESFYFLENFSNKYSNILKKKSLELITNLKEYKEIIIKSDAKKNNTNKSILIPFIIEKDIYDITKFITNKEIINNLRVFYIDNAIKLSEIISEKPKLIKKDRNIVFYYYQKFCYSHNNEEITNSNKINNFNE